MNENTKSRGGDCRLRLSVAGGSASRKMSFPPCRLRHPHRHAWHDAIRRDGKKSGLWPFKKSCFRRYKKQLLIGRLSPALPWGLLFPSVHAHRPMWMSLSTDVDVVVGRRAALWGITALLTDWTTDMMHVMLFSAITCSAVGVAARLQTAILTLAIIIAGSYHLIRGLVPIVT